MFTLADKLGIGVYSAAEAARYARVSPGLINRWVFGDSKGNPVIERQLRRSPEKVVTFLDFVQTLAVREVRNRHKISLQKIRQGVDAAKDRYGIPYPLACEHTTYLFSDLRGEGHGEIVIRLPVESDEIEEQYVQVTGREQGNRVMQAVVEMFLQDLRFDPVTGLAAEYSPMAGENARVVLNPHRRFGEPIVEPGGYTAETLWHATNREGGLEEAAEAYGVSLAEIRLANRYCDAIHSDRVA